jgi:hypothetical protein
VAARVFTWDWKEQPPLAEVAEAIAEVSGGTVHMRQVDTGGDEYALVVSDRQVDDAEAGQLVFGDES